MLTTKALILKLQDLLTGQCTVDDVADWAAHVHLQYETNQTTFEPGHEQLILDILVDLIHNQDEALRLRPQELQQKIEALKAIEPLTSADA